jgi:putative nucleotidyltransferase with HDIG domain
MLNDYARFFRVFVQVSKAIHAGSNTGEILENIVGNIREILEAKGCIFWIVNRDARKIEARISSGFAYRSLESVSYDALTEIFDPNGGEAVFIEDARYEERIPNLERLGKKRVKSVSGFFFDIVGPYQGILAVYFADLRQLQDREMELVSALGEQGAIALHRTLVYDEDMLHALKRVVEGFVLVLEAKDPATHGHSLRVAAFARAAAEEMGFPEKEIEDIHHGALLHDIGKIGLEDGFLERLGGLTRREMDAVKQHPDIGARILEPLAFFHDVSPMVRHHHERFDGSGYPDGLKGDRIPAGARIIAACDAFETMISGRARLEKKPLDEALACLEKGAGTLFDPDVLAALFRALRKNPCLVDPNAEIPRCLERAGRNLRSLSARNRLARNMIGANGLF